MLYAMVYHTSEDGVVVRRLPFADMAGDRRRVRLKSVQASNGPTASRGFTTLFTPCPTEQKHLASPFSLKLCRFSESGQRSDKWLSQGQPLMAVPSPDNKHPRPKRNTKTRPSAVGTLAAFVRQGQGHLFHSRGLVAPEKRITPLVEGQGCSSLRQVLIIIATYGSSRPPFFSLPLSRVHTISQNPLINSRLFL